MLSVLNDSMAVYTKKAIPKKLCQRAHAKKSMTINVYTLLMCLYFDKSKISAKAEFRHKEATLYQGPNATFCSSLMLLTRTFTRLTE